YYLIGEYQRSVHKQQSDFCEIDSGMTKPGLEGFETLLLI
ncbi:unnamed protein product, partial [Allacma fusca]